MSNRTLTPHFLIVGAMKSGTTSLYQALSQSPALFLPDDKEPDILHRGRSTSACTRLYTTHFSGAPEKAILGEASTMYTMAPWFPDVAPLARQVCGKDLRLVCIMGDPIDRIIRHLRHDYATGRLKHTDFDRAVAEEPRFVSISDYPAQLAPWVRAFGRDQLHCIRFSDFRDDQIREVYRTLAFLGVDETHALKPVRANSNESLHRAHTNVLARAATTGLYRRWLRPALPTQLRMSLKSLSLSRREPVEVRLSGATLAALRARFADLPARLFELTGFDLTATSRGAP